MRKLIALLAASALAGCVNMAPPHERPALPTAPEYPSAFAGDVTLGQRATDVAWQDFFADPFWVVQRSLIVSLFLGCAGASLVLAEARGRPARAFWRRWAAIAGCALLVSAASWLLFPPLHLSYSSPDPHPRSLTRAAPACWQQPALEP